ncbi:helix-turn-helix domain-containing protein [Nitratireductor sp. ac15]
MSKPFTPATLAEFWGCSERHVRKMIESGELPAFRLGGKLLRIRREVVEAYQCQNGDLQDLRASSASHGTKATSGDVIALGRQTQKKRPASPRLDTPSLRARWARQ